MSEKKELVINALDIINKKNGYCFVLTYDPEQIEIPQVHNIYKEIRKIVDLPILCLPKSMQLFDFEDKEICIQKVEEWLQRMKNNEDLY